ncbi:unnamed protein product [Nippostrongylus brasiliensis]|uniref:Serpentine receptor class gamma n=1 Tax=Nippostrongylus brasiliensis TaxID=27835 RepID=A0A0N4YH57_NIPBR|nr:unnamed protein product [Nippostrongylus brasiliensis]
MGSSNSSVSYSTTCVPINQTELIIFYAIQGVYGSLSIALYIMNIRALMNRRNPLDKVFCKLYITSAVLSTVYFLFHYCIQRFSNVGFFCRQLLEIFAEPTWVLNPYKSVATYCPVAILVIHFAISFNRLTVVLFPVSASLAMLYASKYLFESPSMQSTVLFFRNFIIDIFILPNAWTLPLLSTSVRRYYASKVFRASKQTVTQTTVRNKALGV